MIKLPAIFKSHAVFQRDKIFRIWGETDASDVSARILEDTNIIGKGSAIVTDGSFLLEMEPVEAGGPYSLEIKSGNDVVLLEDVYFGDVWLAGGQSNMEFQLKNSKDADEEIDISSFKGILIAKDTGAAPETIPLGYSYETYETS